MIRIIRAALPSLALAALLASCGEYRGAEGPEDEATSSEQPAESDDVVVDLSELDNGPAPKITWRDGRTLHVGDREIRLGVETDEAMVLGRRVIERGTNDAGDAGEIRVLDRTGEVTARYPDSVSRLVTNDERNIVAWIADDNTPMVIQAGHRKALELPREPRGRNGDAVAVIGNDCFNGPETVEGAGCSVYFTLARQDRSVPFVASEHGFVDPADTKIRELLDVHEDGAKIGTLGVSDDELCSRYEREETSYETCEHVLDSFSPDGRNILGYPADITEGPTTDRIDVLDAGTGDSRLTLRSEPGKATFWSMVWEDDSHVLAVANQDETTWAIVRVGLDGSAELAVGPKKVPDSTTQFGFGVQP